VSDYVLDASALLALMLAEPGAEAIIEMLPTAVIGAVNLAEVIAKLQERGIPEAEIDGNVAALNLPVIPFDEGQAIASGKLRARTRSLSPGDRACLALAMARDTRAVTKDRGWDGLEIGAKIVVVRG
jgi:PIN domain nuclease of toxin-antitoxin system